MSGAASTLGEAPERVHAMFEMRDRLQIVGGGAARRRRPGPLRQSAANCSMPWRVLPRSPSGFPVRRIAARAGGARRQHSGIVGVRCKWCAPSRKTRKKSLDRPAESRARSSNSSDPDRAMEFTLPPGELDRIFVESKRRALPLPTVARSPGRTPKLRLKWSWISIRTGERLELRTRSRDRNAARSQTPRNRQNPTPVLRATQPARHRIAAVRAVSGLEIPEDVRREMLAGIEDELDPVSAVRNWAASPCRARAFYAWLGAAIARRCCCSRRSLHHNREWSIARALYGLTGHRRSARAARICPPTSCASGASRAIRMRTAPCGCAPAS